MLTLLERYPNNPWDSIIPHPFIPLQSQWQDHRTSVHIKRNSEKMRKLVLDWCKQLFPVNLEISWSSLPSCSITPHITIYGSLLSESLTRNYKAEAVRIPISNCGEARSLRRLDCFSVLKQNPRKKLTAITPTRRCKVLFCETSRGFARVRDYTSTQRRVLYIYTHEEWIRGKSLLGRQIKQLRYQSSA